MLSSCALSYCRSGKCERAACRSVLTLCKWLLADWKDLTAQLKQAAKRGVCPATAGGGGQQPPNLTPLSRNIAALLDLPLEDQGVPRITPEITGTMMGITHNRQWKGIPNSILLDPSPPTHSILVLSCFILAEASGCIWPKEQYTKIPSSLLLYSHRAFISQMTPTPH